MGTTFPIVGGIATMPSRLDSLRLALPQILKQVERLYVYFDQYESIPVEFLLNPKIIPYLKPADASNLGCSGKFYGLRDLKEPSIYLTFDDDIIYPDHYADHMHTALRRYQFKAIVGIHGSIHQYQTSSYFHNVLVFHFPNALEFDVLVDELGTGTCAFLSSLIDVDPRKWEHKNMSDLMLMITAIESNIQRVAIRRSQNFLKAINTNQDDSIHLATSKNDILQTKIINHAMKTYPDSWAMSSS